MNRFAVVLIGLAGLVAAGCDNATPAGPNTAAENATASAPAATKPAIPPPQIIDLATAVVTSKRASLVDDVTAGGKLLKTDPAFGGYSMTVNLPVILTPAKITLELEVRTGAVGAVVTEGTNSNAWVSNEMVAEAGAPAVLEMEVKSLDPAKALLIRNSNKTSASEAILKSIKVTPTAPSP